MPDSRLPSGWQVRSRARHGDAAVAGPLTPRNRDVVQARRQAAATRLGPESIELRDRDRNEASPRADEAAARTGMADPAGGEVRFPGGPGRGRSQDILRHA